MTHRIALQTALASYSIQLSNSCHPIRAQPTLPAPSRQKSLMPEEALRQLSASTLKSVWIPARKHGLEEPLWCSYVHAGSPGSSSGTNYSIGTETCVCFSSQVQQLFCKYFQVLCQYNREELSIFPSFGRSGKQLRFHWTSSTEHEAELFHLADGLCLNGGTSIPSLTTGEHMFCICSDGFTGRQCETGEKLIPQSKPRSTFTLTDPLVCCCAFSESWKLLWRRWIVLQRHSV